MGKSKKYRKDFDGWNARKKRVDGSGGGQVLFQEREVWWCAVGVNVGYELDGKGQDFMRPVLVVKKMSVNSFLGVPLTRKRRGLIRERGLERFYSILEDAAADGEEKERAVVLSQARMFDARRLVYMKYRMHENVFDTVTHRLKKLLF